MRADTPNTKRRARPRVSLRTQLICWGLATILTVLALWTLGPVLLPFFIGAGIAYLLDPVADRLERAGLSRTLAVTLITLGMVGALVVISLLIMPLVIRQATALIVMAPQMMVQGHGFLSNMFPGIIPELDASGRAWFEMAASMREQVTVVARHLLGSMRGVLGTLSLLVITPVVAFYLLLDWDHLMARIDALLPREHAPVIRRLAKEIDKTLSGFMRGQGLVILILAGWYGIMLMLVGLPFGLFIGVMAAVLSFIPYVGTLVGGTTAIGVALFTFWGEPMWIGAVVVIFVIGQILEGNYLQPKIVGQSIGLHPVWLMLALSVFGALFGFVGLVLAVPVAAALGVLARFMTARYVDSPLYTGRGALPEAAPPLRVELVNSLVEPVSSPCYDQGNTDAERSAEPRGDV